MIRRDSCDSAILQPAALLPWGRWMGDSKPSIGGVAFSAETCQPGDMVVIDCVHPDPERAIADALAGGASCLLCEQLLPCPLPQCIVPCATSAAAVLQHALAECPGEAVFTIGVVGPAGKTSTSLLIAAALRAGGYRTAYHTDLGTGDGIVQETPRARPQRAEDYIDWLASARDCGCSIAVLEIDTTTLASHCLVPIQLDMLVVTGDPGRIGEFGPQVLEQALDSLRPSGLAVVSADSTQTVRRLKDADVRHVTYGLRKTADVSAKIFDQVRGQTTVMVTAGDTTAVMETSLTGSGMTSNQLAAITVAVMTEQPLVNAIAAVSKIRQIPGRLDRIAGYDRPTVVLDDADNAERLGDVLRGLRRERQGGKLWCVLAAAQCNCDDDRARLGQTTERYADHVIYTSGTAGKKRFLQAAHAMLDGVAEPGKPRLVADRQRAIAWAIQHAAANDIILIAGGYPDQSPQQHRCAIEADRGAVQEALAPGEDLPQDMILKFPAVAGL